MSWLARSLANSLKFDHNDEDSDTEAGNGRLPIQREEENGEEKSRIESPDDVTGRGVKEDLSELTKTLTRQLWGVASFLAPPPSERSEPLVSATNRMSSSADCSVTDWNRWESSAQSVSGRRPDPEMHDSAGIEGIRSDFAEIGGKFKTGFSKLSNNKAVSEISKIASTFLPFGSDEDSEEKYTVENAVGVTNEVMAFARNIAMHPETWLDFPLADDEDSDDFDMSDAQQEHALAVERLAPRLAALRIELCPNYMSEGLFWKIYFVLLHSRLNKHDAELLSTPQIVEARAMLMQDLQKRTCPEPDWSGRGPSHSREPFNSLHKERFFSQPSFATVTMPLTMSALELPADLETEKHPVVCSETQFIDKTVVKEEPAIKKELKENSSAKHLDQRYEEDDEDDWLQDESSEMAGFARTTIPLGNEEDVSFSDLEDDDDDGDMGSSSKIETQNSVSTAVKDSCNWAQFNDGRSNATENTAVELSHSTENKELNDWLSLDNVDA